MVSRQPGPCVGRLASEKSPYTFARASPAPPQRGLFAQLLHYIGLAQYTVGSNPSFSIHRAHCSFDRFFSEGLASKYIRGRGGGLLEEHRDSFRIVLGIERVFEFIG